ncbi:hypothetical protein SSX86_014616 [Deinandra increscens subsp. villosa]|uniref:Uncharacterized protein n=1 Tax=Deinandra increscens subsp. villosa TaxID=3103831 RepID=A0AAP0H286_9ASTR
MQISGEINDIGVSPSFSCYSNDNLTSTAAAKVSREAREEQFHEFSAINEEDFEFSFEYSGEQFSSEELAFEGRILLPIFNTDLVTKDDVDHDDSSAVIPLEKMLPGDSSDESEELDDAAAASGTFCVTWRKADVRSPVPDHIKKSRSTGSDESGSRRWKIKDILRRSNSAGKETVYFLCPKRVEASCKKGSVKSVVVPKGAGNKPKLASSPSIHELFYVQKRAEQKGGRVKSYLPYRQDILGFKVHVNGDANKKLPF